MFDTVKQEVYRALDERGIAYRALEHERVHTIEDCAPIEAQLNALIPKNLFLTPRNQSAYYLLVAMPHALFRTADISKQIGSSRLSFAGEEPLERLLCTRPGAISPMGLLFAQSESVRLLVDRALQHVPVLGFHPCDSTATLAMTNEVFFEDYLHKALHKSFDWVTLPSQ